jgi:hypothetical protein
VRTFLDPAMGAATARPAWEFHHTLIRHARQLKKGSLGFYVKESYPGRF